MGLARKSFLTATAAAAAVASAVPARAATAPVPLRIISFATPALLPVYAAIDQGFFAREHIDVTITTTPGSIDQFQHFSAGDFEIASTAMDNVIAYDAGQGEAELANAPDFVAVLGCDNGLLRFYGRPEIASVADLRGKPLGVDALSTGYAFVLRAMLAKSGLHDGDVTLVPLGNTAARLKALLAGTVAATIVSAPGDLAAAAQGMKQLGDVYATIGPYLGNVIAMRRSWLAANADVAHAYVRATRAGLAWSFDPANRAAAAALLVSHGGMSTDTATAMVRLLLAPGGLSPTGAIDVAAVQNVLALRAAYASPTKPLAGPAAYIDLLSERTSHAE